MGFLDWLTGSSPVTAAAEGAVNGILGKVDAIIQDFHLPPEKELQYAQLRAELKVEAIKAQYEAIKGAQDMQLRTQSAMPAVLSLLITIGFFGLLSFLAIHSNTDVNRALDIMLGSLGSAWMAVVAFYFGSSSGSEAKSLMLYQSVPKNGGGK